MRKSFAATAVILFVFIGLLNSIEAYRGIQNLLRRNAKALKLSEMGPSSIPKPTVITPSQGSSPEKGIDKFLMMYTCKLCNGRNAHMVITFTLEFVSRLRRQAR